MDKLTKKTIFVFLIMIFLFSIFGCSEEKRPKIKYKINNVVRVFMHRELEYSFFSQEPGNAKVTIRHYCFLNDVKIFADVPKDNPMWVEASGEMIGIHEIIYKINIHLHSVEEVNGGGWRINRGKFGAEEGQTTVVE
jgi:hypothetical protein